MQDFSDPGGFADKVKTAAMILSAITKQTFNFFSVIHTGVAHK